MTCFLTNLTTMEFFPSITIAAPLFLLLLVSTGAHQLISARTLPIAQPPSYHSRHHQNGGTQPSISFMMRSALISTSTGPSTTPNLPRSSSSSQYGATPLPFAKPITGFIPAVPWPNQLPHSQNGLNYDLLSRATLEELELGTVNPFEEDLFDNNNDEQLTGQQDEGSALSGSSWKPVAGKGKGVYVASSEDGSSYMMAMTAHLLAGQEEEADDHSLRFFGVRNTDGEECHLAVIGGTGKFENANGYAAIETVVMSTSGADDLPKNMLLFRVYLS